MPRSIWNGALAFGMVTVPVKVFGATEDRSVHFREVHLSDAAGIAHRLVDPTSGEEIARDQVVRGCEVAPGEWVELSSDEVKAAEAPARKAVEIDVFVPGEQIDPVFYDKAYDLAPQKGGEAGYALLAAAIERSGRVALGRVVLRTREQNVAVRPAGDGLLRMHTLHAADEIVAADDLEDLPKASRAPTGREVEMAKALVKSLHTEFDPTEFRDEHRERLLELVRRKAEGEELDLPEPEPAEPTDDLLAALQASLDAVGAGRG